LNVRLQWRTSRVARETPMVASGAPQWSYALWKRRCVMSEVAREVAREVSKEVSKEVEAGLA
jgi:hypothetical protein